MAFGNQPTKGPNPAVALTGLLMAVRAFLRNGSTGNRERLQQALDIFDNDKGPK